MKAALYIRVSDEDQVEGSSIDAQKTLLLRKCEQLEYTPHDFYIDDGYSAKNMRRPALTRMLKDVQHGLFQVVLFWRLDRFTRNSKDFQKMVEILQKYNAGIKSATENIDTTSAFGRFQLELTVSLAQLERETTAERVHFVMEDRHRKGQRNGAAAPYGYELVDGKLVINPMEAEIVKRIYSLYQRNKSTAAIAKQFNSEGVPKDSISGIWAPFSVYYILTNPAYCGKLRWNYRKLSGARTGKEIIVDGDHPAIISEEEFDTVQRMRQFRKKVGKSATSQYAFTGVVRCGRCGYGMVGDSKSRKNDRYRYYKCLGRFNYGVCNMPIISEISVHEAFLNLINPDNKNIEQYYVAPEVAAASEDEMLLDQLHNELENLQKRKKKWQLAYANDVISLEELRQHTEEDRQREEFLKTQLEEIPNKKTSRMDPMEMIQQLRHLHDIWYQIDDEVAKKNFINEAFQYITINTDVTEAKGGPGRRVPVYITDWDFNT
jgi:site-specific DNA recombinase